MSPSGSSPHQRPSTDYRRSIPQDISSCCSLDSPRYVRLLVIFFLLEPLEDLRRVLLDRLVLGGIESQYVRVVAHPFTGPTGISTVALEDLHRRGDVRLFPDCVVIDRQFIFQCVCIDQPDALDHAQVGTMGTEYRLRRQDKRPRSLAGQIAVLKEEVLSKADTVDDKGIALKMSDRLA